MGKDCGSCLHGRFVPWEPLSFNCESLVPDQVYRSAFPAFKNLCPHMVSANGSFPTSAASRLNYFKVDRASEHNWFYCLSHLNEAVPSIPKMVFHENLCNSFQCGQEAIYGAIPGLVQKRFLVFDQSGIGKYLGSNEVGSSQHLNFRNSMATGNGGSHQSWPGTKNPQVKDPWPVISDNFEANQEVSEGREMHEDTQELDALLYSDGDSDYEDEETSTGHSPSAMTGDEQQVVLLGVEKVATSIGKKKRKRFPDEESDTSLMDTASSLEPQELWECDEDAESSCAKGRTAGKTYSSSTNKRLQREKMQETVKILQSIIPGGKGKDAVYIIDEAINYLTSLKLKAKSLGISLE